MEVLLAGDAVEQGNFREGWYGFMDFNNTGFGQQGFGQQAPAGFAQGQHFPQPNQGFAPQGPAFGQPQQMPAVPGFDQMAQEFQQRPAHPAQAQVPDGWGFGDASGDAGGMADPFGNGGAPDPFGMGGTADSFGAGATADPFGNGGATDPFGAGATADPFGNAGASDPFGAAAYGMGGTDPFAMAGGVSAGMSDTQEVPQKWWQKGARIFLLGGAGILLLAIIVFIIATNVSKQSGKSKGTPATTQPVQQQATQPATQPVTQPASQPVVQTVTVNTANGWQVVGDTNGFTFVETRAGEFIVKELRLYYRNEGGIQIRSVAAGLVDGYPGEYEVELPRSAALIDKITLGYKFIVSFDVYKSADGKTIYLENLRPDK